jgi:hypothetical protein
MSHFQVGTYGKYQGVIGSHEQRDVEGVHAGVSSALTVYGRQQESG